MLFWVVITVCAIWLIIGVYLCLRGRSFWIDDLGQRGPSPIIYWVLGPVLLPVFRSIMPLLEKLEKPKNWDIFLSYSHWDCLWASAMYGVTRYAGAKVFLDFVVINRGAGWREVAKNGINESDMFAYLNSPDARESDNVQYEVHHRKRTYSLMTESWRRKRVEGSKFRSDGVKSSRAFGNDNGIAEVPIQGSVHPSWKYKTPRETASESIGNVEGWLEINLPAVEMMASLFGLPLPPRGELDYLMRQYLEFAVRGEVPRLT